jgi:hypothetical protein
MKARKKEGRKEKRKEKDIVTHTCTFQVSPRKVIKIIS